MRKGGYCYFPDITTNCTCVFFNTCFATACFFNYFFIFFMICVRTAGLCVSCSIISHIVAIASFKIGKVSRLISTVSTIATKNHTRSVCRNFNSIYIIALIVLSNFVSQSLTGPSCVFTVNTTPVVNTNCGPAPVVFKVNSDCFYFVTSDTFMVFVCMSKSFALCFSTS